MQKRIMLSNLIHLRLSVESLLNIAMYRKQKGLNQEIINKIKSIDSVKLDLVPSNFLQKYERIVSRLKNYFNFNYKKLTRMIEEFTNQINYTLNILH